MPVKVDINYNNITICCQNHQSIFETIYFFMLTPFQQSQNYICQTKVKVPNDTATFPHLGPLKMNFNESVYPGCHTGMLGFSKSSYFLSLLPHTQPYFIIEQIAAHQYQLKVGGSVTSPYEQFVPVNSSKLWMARFVNIDFNGISMGHQDVVFMTNSYDKMRVPQKAFAVIKNELVGNYLCIVD